MTSSLYLAIFNLLAKTTSSLQVLDMPLVEIDDEDMRVLFNMATRCHTLHICESMKIDQTLPFLKATVRLRLHGRLHCRYHCSFTICNYLSSCLTRKWNYESGSKSPSLKKNLVSVPVQFLLTQTRTQNHFSFQKSQFQFWVWFFEKIKLGSHPCSNSKNQTWFWSGSY